MESAVPLNSLPCSIEMPSFASENTLDVDEAHFKCISNLSFTNSNTASQEEHVMVPLPQHGTAQAHSMLVSAIQVPSRPKRRHSSSMDVETWNLAMLTIEQPFIHSQQPAKRRRLHTRKPAMDAAHFDNILVRLEM